MVEVTRRVRVSVAAGSAEETVVVEPLAAGRRGESPHLPRSRGAPHRSIVEPLPATPDGARRFEVVVDGWRFELAVEDAARAELRERATRGGGGRGHDGPVDVRALIPGRVVGVLVVDGATVGRGDPVIVVEAMKMQNEVRAPRDGNVARLAVAVGSTVEVGDRLLAIE